MALHEDQRIWLFILTGDPRHLPKQVQPQRKRIPAGKLASAHPENYIPKAKFKRSNPPNAFMNEARAWAGETKYRSHSHRIEDIAKVAKRVHVMKNEKDPEFTPRQSPCYRDMTPDERTGKIHPNVGPQITK